MGVQPAHDLADDAGALDVAAVGPQAHVVHRVEDPALHRLEAVAGVGQRAGVDDRVGVLEERRPHLVADVDVEDVLLEVVGEGVLAWYARAMRAILLVPVHGARRARRGHAGRAVDSGGVTGPEQDRATDVTRAPRHWEADVLLRDGRTAHIRPIRPEDAELLVEFYSRVSDESKYYRFFSPMPQLSERDVDRFTHVDHVDRVAFVLHAVGADDRGRPLRPSVRAPRARPRSRSWSRTTTRAAGSASCCSSTSPRPAASAGSSGSSPRCCPTTSRMIQTFRDAGYRLVSGYEDGVMHAGVPDRRRPTPRSA